MTQSAHEELKALNPILHGELLDWVRFGLQPSQLVHAVLHNDLQKAIAQAGKENLTALRLLTQTVWNYIPSQAWGTGHAYILWQCARKEEPCPNFKFGDC